jgi:hypothetical protein
MVTFKVFAITALAATVFADVAAFNNYASQGKYAFLFPTLNFHTKFSLLTTPPSSTVCGPKSGTSGTYGAALSDLSPLWAGAKYSGSINTSKCSGQNPIGGYSGLACPNTTCGKCYKVCNKGGYGGAAVCGVGNCITMQIIDACPSSSSYNYCKTSVPADERCGASGANAYVSLSFLFFLWKIVVRYRTGCY